ncbi:MAG: PEGA domain-containing protein [Candidatus Levybacteria bacterium]|nr:PEGA domain-containing protein [Candidatus Levybacteria bacterium]
MFRKIILFLTPLLILTILFLLIVIVINRNSGKGALQVTSIPSSQIFLEGKYIGKTPLCLCELPQLLEIGDYNIKLVPGQSGYKTFEQKITLYEGVLTVVDRTFDKETAASSATVITLSPIDDRQVAQLLIVSFPNKAQVVLDSNIVGETPYFVDITPSDHEIKLLKDGYKEKVIKVKGVLGKKLEVTMNLGIKMDLNEKSRTTTPSIAIPKVVVLDTPTGYLNVRSEKSIGSELVTTANPGQILDLISEEEGWYEVKLLDGRTGWISSTYARKE